MMCLVEMCLYGQLGYIEIYVVVLLRLKLFFILIVKGIVLIIIFNCDRVY